MATPDLSVVLVHYHTPSHLEAAVAALRRDLAAAGLRGELLVVDNGSAPEDARRLEALDVTLLTPGRNLGYGAAANLGLGRARGRHRVVMNPDVEVQEGCLGALVAALTDGADLCGPRLAWGAAGGPLLPPTEEVSRTYELMKWWGHGSVGGAQRARRRWRRRAQRFWGAAEPLETSGLSGAMLALRADLLETVGGFDEAYFLYFEEVEWQRRARAAGKRVVLVPGARAVHHYARSAALEPRTQEWFAASERRFRVQHLGAWFLRLLEALPRPAPAPPPAPWADFPRRGLALGEIGGEVPRWVEISRPPLGFPAAGLPLTGRCGASWTPEPKVWEQATPGPYWLTLVAASGRELGSWSVQR